MRIPLEWKKIASCLVHSDAYSILNYFLKPSEKVNNKSSWIEIALLAVRGELMGTLMFVWAKHNISSYLNQELLNLWTKVFITEIENKHN